jgi:hypothetical protein
MKVDVRHRFAIAVVALIAAIAVSGPSSASLGANVIYGTNGPDVIEGTPEVDVIFAKSGDDTISNVGDGDIVYASSGNDTISVVPQTVVNDVSIDGNVGNDTIFGGSADDSDVNLGSGHDVAYLSGCGGYAPDRATTSISTATGVRPGHGPPSRWGTATTKRTSGTWTASPSGTDMTC